jgi:O-antigen ligase
VRRYDQSSGTQRVEQAHNDYLQIVADAGSIGGLIALAFLILLFARGFSAAQVRDRRRRSIILGALTGCFAIAIHSFVEFNLQITSNAQLFLALAALATERIDNG